MSDIIAHRKVAVKAALVRGQLDSTTSQRAERQGTLQIEQSNRNRK